MSSRDVLKGSLVLILGRVGGMVGGFLLFLVLTWRSKEDAGVFRIALTYLYLLDFLPLLGMHRWVAAEISHRSEKQGALFAMSCWFAVGVAAACALVYAAIAYDGVYGPEASNCLKLVALTAIASAINLCVLSALIGVGMSPMAGYLGMAESAARTLISVVLVIMGAPVFWIVFVFAACRCVTALAGFMLVRARTRGRQPIDRALWRAFLSQTPNLALSTIGFLAMRNAAVLLLPIFQGDASAGVYAAAFQLVDLALLAPTMLTISTNHLFAESARESTACLRRNTDRLIAVSAAYLLPIAALGFVLAGPIIAMLFGPAYEAAASALRILLVGACVVALDQVLALAMTVSGAYRADRMCVTIGAATTLAATCGLAGLWGVNGAAIAFVVGAATTVVVRFRLMRRLSRPRLVAVAIWPAALAAVSVGFVTFAAAEWLRGSRSLSTPSAFLLAALGTALYAALLYERGGLTGRRLTRAMALISRGP